MPRCLTLGLKRTEGPKGFRNSGPNRFFLGPKRSSGRNGVIPSATFHSHHIASVQQLTLHLPHILSWFKYATSISHVKPHLPHWNLTLSRGARCVGFQCCTGPPFHTPRTAFLVYHSTLILLHRTFPSRCRGWYPTEARVCVTLKRC